MKSLLKILWTALIIALLSFETANADQSDPEVDTLRAFAPILHIFSTTEGGRLPKSWHEYKSWSVANNWDWQKLNQMIVSGRGYSLEERYSFEQSETPVLTKKGLRIIMMRTLPIEDFSKSTLDKKEQWRYAILQGRNGDLSYERMSELDVIEVYRAAGISLPTHPAGKDVEDVTPLPSRPAKQVRNPADEVVLKEHPELDPDKNPAVKYPEGTPPPASTKKIVNSDRNALEAHRASERVESSHWAWYVIASLIGAAALAAILLRARAL